MTDEETIRELRLTVTNMLEEVAAWRAEANVTSPTRVAVLRTDLNLIKELCLQQPMAAKLRIESILREQEKPKDVPNTFHCPLCLYSMDTAAAMCEHFAHSHWVKQ